MLGLRLAQSVGALGVRHTTRFGSGIHQKTPLLLEPSLRIRPSNTSCRRWLQHKSTPQSSEKNPLSSKSSTPLQKDSDFVRKDHIPTPAEQRKSDWGITKRLLVNVWPKNDWKTRWTVLLGFGLLVSSKVALSRILRNVLNIDTFFANRYSMFKCR